MLAFMSGHLQILHHAKVTAKKISDSLTKILGENKYLRDTDLNDVMQQKLAARILVHELFLKEMDPLKKIEFYIVEIHKQMMLMKEAVDKLSPQDDINTVIPYGLGSKKEKSKNKGKKKVD